MKDESCDEYRMSNEGEVDESCDTQNCKLPNVLTNPCIYVFMIDTNMDRSHFPSVLSHSHYVWRKHPHTAV